MTNLEENLSLGDYDTKEGDGTSFDINENFDKQNEVQTPDENKMEEEYSQEKFDIDVSSDFNFESVEIGDKSVPSNTFDTFDDMNDGVEKSQDDNFAKNGHSDEETMFTTSPDLKRRQSGYTIDDNNNFVANKKTKMDKSANSKSDFDDLGSFDADKQMEGKDLANDFDSFSMPLTDNDMNSEQVQDSFAGDKESFEMTENDKALSGSLDSDEEDAPLSFMSKGKKQSKDMSNEKSAMDNDNSNNGNSENVDTDRKELENNSSATSDFSDDQANFLKAKKQNESRITENDSTNNGLGKNSSNTNSEKDPISGSARVKNSMKSNKNDEKSNSQSALDSLEYTIDEWGQKIKTREPGTVTTSKKDKTKKKQADKATKTSSKEGKGGIGNDMEDAADDNNQSIANDNTSQGELDIAQGGLEEMIKKLNKDAEKSKKELDFMKEDLDHSPEKQKSKTLLESVESDENDYSQFVVSTNSSETSTSKSDNSKKDENENSYKDEKSRANSDMAAFCNECFNIFDSAKELEEHNVKFHGATPSSVNDIADDSNDKSQKEIHSDDESSREDTIKSTDKHAKGNESLKLHIKTVPSKEGTLNYVVAKEKGKCLYCRIDGGPAEIEKNQLKSHYEERHPEKCDKVMQCRGENCDSHFADNPYHLARHYFTQHVKNNICPKCEFNCGSHKAASAFSTHIKDEHGEDGSQWMYEFISAKKEKFKKPKQNKLKKKDGMLSMEISAKASKLNNENNDSQSSQGGSVKESSEDDSTSVDNNNNPSSRSNPKNSEKASVSNLQSKELVAKKSNHDFLESNNTSESDNHKGSDNDVHGSKIKQSTTSKNMKPEKNNRDDKKSDDFGDSNELILTADDNDASDISKNSESLEVLEKTLDKVQTFFKDEKNYRKFSNLLSNCNLKISGEFQKVDHNPVWRCKKCDYVGLYKSMLELHHFQTHGSKCMQCGKPHKTLILLKQHFWKCHPQFDIYSPTNRIDSLLTPIAPGQSLPSTPICNLCSNKKLSSWDQLEQHNKLIHSGFTKLYYQNGAVGRIDQKLLQLHNPTYSMKSTLYGVSPRLESVSKGPSQTTPIAFICLFCNSIFANNSELRDHKRLEHQGKAFVCPRCEFESFQGRFQVEEHFFNYHERRCLMGCPSEETSDIKNFRQMQDHFKIYHPQCRSTYEPNFTENYSPRVVFKGTSKKDLNKVVHNKPNSDGNIHVNSQLNKDVNANKSVGNQATHYNRSVKDNMSTEIKNNDGIYTDKSLKRMTNESNSFGVNGYGAKNVKSLSNISNNNPSQFSVDSKKLINQSEDSVMSSAMSNENSNETSDSNANEINNSFDISKSGTENESNLSKDDGTNKFKEEPGKIQRFQCNLCKFKSKVRDLAYTHIRQKHKEVDKTKMDDYMTIEKVEGFECDVCGALLRNKSLMKNHKESSRCLPNKASIKEGERKEKEEEKKRAMEQRQKDAQEAKAKKLEDQMKAKEEKQRMKDEKKKVGKVSTGRGAKALNAYQEAEKTAKARKQDFSNTMSTHEDSNMESSSTDPESSKDPTGQDYDSFSNDAFLSEISEQQNPTKSKGNNASVNNMPMEDDDEDLDEDDLENEENYDEDDSSSEDDTESDLEVTEEYAKKKEFVDLQPSGESYNRQFANNSGVSSNANYPRKPYSSDYGTTGYRNTPTNYSTSTMGQGQFANAGNNAYQRAYNYNQYATGTSNYDYMQSNSYNRQREIWGDRNQPKTKSNDVISLEE